MLVHEAKSIAFGAAANIEVDYTAPGKALTAAAITYLCGKSDKASFVKKCAKNPLYARLVFFHEKALSDYGSESFTAVHKSLFPDENGGEIRTDELTLTGGSCADPKILRGSLKNVLTKLQQIPSAPEINKADFATQLCCYVRELIILSPFASGNGVVRRAFIQSFCHNRGFTLNYSLGNKDEITAAETEAFASDAPQPLFLLLVKCLGYLQEENDAPARVARPRHRTELPERKQPHKPETEQKKAEAVTAKKAPESVQQPKKAKERIPQPKKPAKDELTELKEIKAALEKLTERVSELIKNSEK